MEKLLVLLNEFETPKSGIVFKSYDDYDGTFYGIDCDGETEVAWSDALICSKKNLFIKWLVENDKIDFDKAYILHNRKDIQTDKIIMLLAISDTPIEDLISYLK